MDLAQPYHKVSVTDHLWTGLIASGNYLGPSFY